MSHHGNIFDPPPNGSWSYRVTSSAPMADGLSVWLVRRSGIPCQTACGIRLLVRTVSDNLWRRFCSQHTDAFSALEVSRRCAMQIDFLLTYLLTIIISHETNQLYPVLNFLAVLFYCCFLHCFNALFLQQRNNVLLLLLLMIMMMMMTMMTMMCWSSWLRR